MTQAHRAEHLSRRRFLALSAGIGVGGLTLSGCAHRLVQSSSSAPVRSVAGTGSLKAHAAARGLFYGCAVDVGLLGTDERYAQLVREQAGMIVAEDAMKWDALRPGPHDFSFAQADALLAFAEANHIKVRGHALCWHRHLPAWFSATATIQNARGLLADHIQQVAGRYAGRMHSWDVVNEAIELNDGRPDALRHSPWLALVGEDYVETAFHMAREADPRALLTYNDYGLEAEDAASHAKRIAVLVLLRRLKARRVPIDAVGVQSHLAAGDRFGPALTAFLAAVRELGLQVFVTELDVDDRALPAEIPARDRAIQRVYADFLGLVLQEPAVRVVMTWGLTDRRPWLNSESGRSDKQPQRSLPFGMVDGEEDQPRAGFFSMRKSFDETRVPSSQFAMASAMMSERNA